MGEGTSIDKNKQFVFIFFNFWVPPCLKKCGHHSHLQMIFPAIHLHFVRAFSINYQRVKPP